MTPPLRAKAVKQHRLDMLRLKSEGIQTPIIRHESTSLPLSIKQWMSDLSDQTAKRDSFSNQIAKHDSCNQKANIRILRSESKDLTPPIRLGRLDLIIYQKFDTSTTLIRYEVRLALLTKNQLQGEGYLLQGRCLHFQSPTWKKRPLKKEA